MLPSVVNITANEEIRETLGQMSHYEKVGMRKTLLNKKENNNSIGSATQVPFIPVMPNVLVKLTKPDGTQESLN